MKLVYRQLSAIAFSVLCFVGACLSSDSVRFDLNPEMVESAWANEVSQGFSNVNVLLKDEYKKHLLALTENNIGKRLTISCDAYYWHAMVLTKIGDYQRASSSLTEAVNRKCDGVADRLGSFLFLRGVIQHKAQLRNKAYEDYEMAIQAFQERLDIKPTDIDAMTGICQALSMMNRKKEALELIRKKSSEYPEDQMLKETQKFVQEFDAARYLEKI